MKQEKLFDLLKAAVSPCECVKAAKQELLENGFEEIDYTGDWKLVRGGRYVLNHHDTTMFAFTVGSGYNKKDMVRIAAAHTDYPYLRIKPNPDFMTNSYAQVNVEVYGGPILNTWFDRPLGVAGRVAIKSEDEMTTDYFLSFLARELSVEKSDIIDFELNTFCMEEPCFVGVNDTMISSPRIDNQSSCRALLDAIEDGNRADGINIIALFDHEEIGSNSKQGAASIMLHDMLRRILRNMDLSENEIDESIYDAMLLSVDVAHALHPNKKEKMDITNKPVMGKGFCIKQACSQSYATDAQAIAILCQLCDEKDILYQRFVNRSDSRGGSTLGSIAGTLLPVKTVDIGIPILAMHSACELMGVRDMKALSDCVTAFFGYH